MAFRIIRDFVEQPVLQITCDRSCGYNCTCAVKAGTEFDQNTHVAFIQTAAQQGWHILLHEHVCPKHVEKDRGEVSRILVPEFRASARTN